jgi:hypothetical protein
LPSFLQMNSAKERWNYFLWVSCYVLYYTRNSVRSNYSWGSLHWSGELTTISSRSTRVFFKFLRSSARVVIFR